jgi:hypothetical protein
MAILLRRLVISMLIPFLWRRWRERSKRDARDTAALEPAAGAGSSSRPAPGARDVTDGLVVGEEY